MTETFYELSGLWKFAEILIFGMQKCQRYSHITTPIWASVRKFEEHLCTESETRVRDEKSVISTNNFYSHHVFFAT